MSYFKVEDSLRKRACQEIIKDYNITIGDYLICKRTFGDDTKRIFFYKVKDFSHNKVDLCVFNLTYNIEENIYIPTVIFLGKFNIQNRYEQLYKEVFFNETLS
jgi:hypothetical protein